MTDSTKSVHLPSVTSKGRQWQISRLESGLGEHAPAWDALNQRLFDCHPLLDSRFVDCLLKHFGDGSEQLCILTSNGAHEAMCLLRPKRLGVWASFLPSQAQVGPTLITTPDSLAELVRTLPGINAQIDFLCNDPNLGNLTNGTVGTLQSMDHALTMSISLNGTFEDYWSARSKKLIQNIGRYERRLLTDNIVRRFVCIKEPSAMSAAVTRYATLESMGWKGRAGTAVAEGNKQGAFYIAVMNRYASSGEAMVYELWLDDHLAASRLIIASQKMLIMIKTTYNESFVRYAPGRLLLREVIEQLFAECPGKAVEFYTDANADQLVWATHQRWISHRSFFRNHTIATIKRTAQISRRALRRLFRSTTLQPSDTSVTAFNLSEDIPPDVEQLLATAEQHNFQLGAPWFKNLAATVYPDDSGVRLYVLRRGGHAVAAIPVRAMKVLLGWKLESLSNYYTSLFAPAIAPDVKDQEMALLIQAVIDQHTPIVEMRFAPMEAGSFSYRRLQNALRLNGLAQFDFFCFGNWYLSAPGDWTTYLMGRSGTHRSTIKRMTKKFATDGGTIALIFGGPELAQGIKDFEQVYSTSWKQPEPYVNFIPELMDMAANKGQLRLGIASLNEQPIAAQLWFVAGGKAYIFKVAYNEKYKTYAPGTLVTAMLMEHVIDKDKVTEVDFLTGDDPYKKTWMSHRRERWGIIAFNPTTIRGMIGLIKEVLGRLLRPYAVRIKARFRQTTLQTSKLPVPAQNSQSDLAP